VIIHSRYRRLDHTDGQVARRSLKGTLSSPRKKPAAVALQAFRGLRAPVEPGAYSEGDPGGVRQTHIRLQWS
jgi:hypothetical protein